MMLAASLFSICSFAFPGLLRGEVMEAKGLGDKVFDDPPSADGSGAAIMLRSYPLEGAVVCEAWLV